VHSFFCRRREVSLKRALEIGRRALLNVPCLTINIGRQPFIGDLPDSLHRTAFAHDALVYTIQEPTPVQNRTRIILPHALLLGILSCPHYNWQNGAARPICEPVLLPYAPRTDRQTDQ